MKNKLKLIAIIILIMIVLPGLKAQYVGELNYNPADVNVEQTDGWDVATIPGCSMETEPGKPFLPIKHQHIAIPEDKTVVSVEILGIQQQEITGTYHIMPAQPESIPGEPEPEFVKPDPDIYETDASYPEEYIFFSTSGFMSGVHIAGVLFYPLRYNPVTKKLILISHLEYRLVYANEDNSPVKPRRMLSHTFSKKAMEIKNHTENPADVEDYFLLEKTDEFTGAAFLPDEFPNFNGHPVAYVIITNEVLKDGFQEIADWKTSKGIPAVVRTVEWIYSYYSGTDYAEKVRNFIIDAYQNWGADFFMLGGDSEIIPIRFAWSSCWYEVNLNKWPNGHTVPADIYYACLDGNWNADGDITYGEANWDRENDGTFERIYPTTINLDDVDRSPEVCIGRIPIENMDELDRYKTKLFEYEKTSQGNENHVLLFDALNPVYWDKDTFKNAFDTDKVSFTEKYCYTNPPATYLDVLAEFNGSNGTLHHIICGLGHGGPTSFAAAIGSFDRSDMDNLINEDRSQILCLAHCTTMPWDKNTVTEHYINSQNGGVALIANTAIGAANIPNDYFEPFIEKIYNEDCRIGKSFNEMKIIDYGSTFYDCLLRTEFFALSLASDPEMPVWTDSPDPENPMIVDVPSNVYTGEQTLEIDIDNVNIGDEVTICLYKEDELYAIETESYSGDPFEITCTPNTPDNIEVTVTAHNYLPVEAVIPVSYNPGIHLYANELTIDDDIVSPSNGNDDGLVDAGETFEMIVTLKNTGLTGATGVNGTLSSSSDFITITQNQSAFGNISSLGTGTSITLFVISVDNNAPDQFLATFYLNITDTQMNTYHDELHIVIHAPYPLLTSTEITTTLGEEKVIDPDDHVGVTFEIYNKGTGFITGLNGVITESSDYIDYISAAAQPFGDIASHTTDSNQGEFKFHVIDTYNGETIEISLILTDEFGKEWELAVNFNKPPDIPDLFFTSTNTDITVYWEPITDILGYNIYRCDVPEGVYEKINMQIITGFSGFTDAGLLPLKTFYYKACCVSQSGLEGDLSEYLEAWTTLPYHPDWPLMEINPDVFGGRTEGSPISVDFDANGTKEIYFTLSAGPGDEFKKGGIFGFYHDMEEIYDIDTNSTTYSGIYEFDSAGSRATPAIGDLDNDHILEIITTTQGEKNIYDMRKLFIHSTIDRDEDEKPDLIWSGDLGGPDFKGAVLSDIDYDDDLEIIAKGGWCSKIYVLDYNNGTVSDYAGWPKETLGNGYGMPVAANLDNIGDKELIFGFDNSEEEGEVIFNAGIYIYKSNGDSFIEETNGEFYQNGPFQGVYDPMDSPPTIVDINHDGYNEIVCVSGRYNSGDPKGRIFILDRTGHTIQGWGYDSHIISITKIDEIGTMWLPATSVGDIDDDGEIEVVVADHDSIYIWNHDSTEFIDPIYVQGLQAKFISPLIADVDEDDEMEIIVASNDAQGAIFAYNIDRSKVLGWPLRLSGVFSTPCIDDIDNDNKNEIIATSGSEIYVWDTEGEANKIEWGKYRHDSYNSGTYSDFCYYDPNNPRVISDNEEWTENYIMQSDIIIESSGFLTIHSSVAMPENAKIVVECGGKLIIDGGSLTTACKGSWQGIQVWGNSSATQFPDEYGNYQQGYLKLKNGATIENAIVAVDLWKPDDFSKTGGIVYATDANFLNNAKSVHALCYRNFNPNYPGIEFDYASNFKNCVFEITQDYFGDATFYKHVDLAHVKGIDFQGCDFSLAQNVTGVSTWNHAIAGYTAKFGVSAICNSPQNPCPEIEYDRSTFTGFYSAVNADNEGYPVTFSVNRADFINNAYGVKTHYMNNASVLFSNFEIGNLWDCGAGIFSDNITGLAFEENEFSKYMGGPVSDYFGIIINNSEAVNEVYKNNYTGLSYANFSDGKNWFGGNIWEGLAYYCNENENNYADFYVADDTMPNKHSGIQSFQGNDYYTAGNTFTQSGATWHFYNGGEYLVRYYYNQNNSDEIPDDTRINDIIKVGRNVSNTCPSHYGGETGLKVVLTEQQKAETELEYYGNLTDYNSVKSLYDSYIDGGNTDAELLDIQTAQPDDMWTLREQLLEDSPHLSFEVLKEAAGKTDVFTESVLFDLLAANPDELKKDTLISYLENKEEPLPDYMIDLLKQLAEGTTYKTALQQQMANYKHNYTRAAQDIIRSILNDTATNNAELRDWLDNLGGITSDRQIISSYISEGNFTDAFTLADMLPQLYNLEGNELTEYNYYMDMLDLHHTLYQQGRNTFQLDSTEKAFITSIADNSNGVAGAQAKSILEYVYNEYYVDCPEADGSAGYKQSRIINPESLGRVYGLGITVKPNPAKQWAAFDYTLPERKTSAIITITNSNGKTVEILEVNGQQGQKLWDTRNIKPGLYFYTIKVEEYSISGKIIISK